MQPPAESPPGSHYPSASAADPKSPRPVILVGASIRAAAQSAQRAGFAVTGVDRFGDIDTRRACQRSIRLAPDASPATILESLPHAPVFIVSGMSHCGPLQSLLAATHRVFGWAQRWPASNESLSQLQRIARNSGVRVPETVRCETVLGETVLGETVLGETVRGEQRSAGQLPGRWLVKTDHSAGGMGIHWLGENRHGTDTPVTVAGCRQRWVPGQALGATFVNLGGCTALLGVCRSSFTRQSGRPFAYAGSSGPIPVSENLTAKLNQFASAFAGESAVAGLFNVDLILDRSGQVWILEINPRWSASSEIVEQALWESGDLTPGETLFQWHWDALTGKSSDRSIGRQVPQAGRRCLVSGNGVEYWKRIVYSNRTGRFDPRPLHRIDSRDNGREIRVADVPSPQTRVRRGEPVLTVIWRSQRSQPIGWREKRKLIAAIQQTVVPDSS